MDNIKFGALEPKIDIRDYQYEPASLSEESKTYPDKFSLVMPAIKDQGSVGSCVAHASATIEEYFNKKQQNSDDRLSVGYIYGCRYSYKGEGMYLRDALKTLKDRGISTHKEFPYNKEVPEIIELFEAKESWQTDTKNKITSYFNISTIDRENKIKKALMDHGPVMVSIKWYNDFRVKNGIINSSLTGNSGGHCVVICGWNKDGWLIQNSWGRDWGDDGKAIYPYEYPLREVWGITDSIIHDNKDIKKKNKKYDTIYKILNIIYNILKQLKFIN